MKVNFQIYPNWTHFQIITDSDSIKFQIETDLVKLLSFNFAEYSRDKAGNVSFRENFIPMHNSMNSFPTGLLIDVVSLLESNIHNIGLEYDFNFEYKKNNPLFYVLDHPRDTFQDNVVEICKKEGRGYIKAATGAGKTNMIISLMGELGGKSLLLAPGTSLCLQHKETIDEAFDFKSTFISGKKSLEQELSDIVVASPDTLWSNFGELVSSEWFSQFDNLFIDECQSIGYTESKVIYEKQGTKKIFSGRKPAGFNSMYNLIMACNAPYRFGFSATPKNLRLLKASIGDKLYEITPDQLIKTGRLSVPNVYMVNIPAKLFRDFNTSLNYNIIENEKRNDFIIKLMKYFYDKDMVCLVIVDSKSKQLKYLEENAKFASVTMGDMKADDRQVIYDKIKDGEIKSLISTVVKVGINIPNIDVIIRASGNISEVKVSQERGRGMRKTKDKDSFILIDFFDDDGMFNESDFGYAKKGFLRKHSEARVNYYKKIKNSNLYRVESRDIFELLNKNINIKGD